MLPQAFKDFLGSPVMASIGSRNAALRTSIHRCHGVRLLDDARLEAFVRNTGGLAENVADHPLVTLNMGHPMTNIAFQVKGPCLRLTAPTAEHLEAYEEFGARHRELLAQLGFPLELVQQFVQPPSLVAEIAIGDLYNQTPGPNAGKRILPEVAP